MFLLTSEEKIHFENEPFWALVKDEGDRAIKCTPVVYENQSKCGIGLFFENGLGKVWGPGSPRNLIAAWRGTEVLRLLDTIGRCTLAEAYYTGIRNPGIINQESVDLTVRKIGQRAYDTIMRMSVPSVIVKAILDNQGKYGEYGRNLSPDIYPIIEEMRAGTIQWKQWQNEFVAAGIKHPDEIDSEKRVREQIVAKFNSLLISYAQSRALPLTCKSMNDVVDALLTLVDGAQETQSDRVLVALAGIAGHVVHLKGVSFPLSLIEKKERDKRLNEMKETAIDHSAAWLASGFVKWLRYSRESKEKKLLYHLFEEYFPLFLQGLVKKDLV